MVAKMMITMTTSISGKEKPRRGLLGWRGAFIFSKSSQGADLTPNGYTLSLGHSISSPDQVLGTLNSCVNEIKTNSDGSLKK